MTSGGFSTNGSTSVFLTNGMLNGDGSWSASGYNWGSGASLSAYGYCLRRYSRVPDPARFGGHGGSDRGRSRTPRRAVRGQEARAAPAIELMALRRDFGERTALAGVRPGSRAPASSLAVLGPNGSGKSTLLRILAGLLRPSGGQVSVLGCPLPKETYRLRGTGRLSGPRAAALPGPERAREPRPRRRAARARSSGRERRIERLLEAVGMERRADDRVAELSAGMRQRVDICRAVLHEPELLLLDEPDAHLDCRGPRADRRR